MSNLHQLSAAAAAAAIVDGSVSPVALVDACLARIRQRDGEILAWVHVDEAGARKAAREREAEAREKKFRGPLHGVPVAIKDIIDVAAMPTTCGAAAFAHRQPAEDAACIARLRAVGAIILGKVATTEFAYFEPAATRNPWNTAHTPGGSSSGSAASVAARMVPLALGSQTVGSVLRPAAYCGVVGFKGTFAAIPTDGVNPLAQSLDHVGIFAREVADIRLAFAILSGSALRQSALPPHFALAPELIERASAEVAASVRAAADRLAAAGATVSEIALPKSFAGIHAAGRAVMEGEFAASQEALHRDHAADYRPRTRALIEFRLGAEDDDLCRRAT